jgi:hypothetical protein
MGMDAAKMRPCKHAHARSRGPAHLDGGQRVRLGERPREARSAVAQADREHVAGTVLPDRHRQRGLQVLHPRRKRRGRDARGLELGGGHGCGGRRASGGGFGRRRGAGRHVGALLGVQAVGLGPVSAAAAVS